MTQEAASIQLGPEAMAHPKGGGWTYLVVADDSDEFPVALKYAAKAARANDCHIGIVYAIETQEFQHWGNIENRIRNELRQQAENVLNQACLVLDNMEGVALPSLYLEEGECIDVLVDIIGKDPNIALLVLAGGTQGGSGPGPLVSYFTGKGLSRLRVPVLVVPDNIF